MFTRNPTLSKMTVTEYQEVTRNPLLTPPLPRLPIFNARLTRPKRVYALLCQIPKGKVASYASLSKALSSSPRAVGGALRRNPFAPEVPCHRIICADGVSSSSTMAKFMRHLLTGTSSRTIVNWWIQGRAARCAFWH